jgi:multimeric flavodoxin WrbA
MRNVLAILGSPRARGNSTMLADAALSVAADAILLASPVYDQAFALRKSLAA